MQTFTVTSGRRTAKQQSRGSGAGCAQAREPRYLHVANAIAERLSSGHYTAGDRLPSESEFSAEFGVSHMTLRRALKTLADRRLITSSPGRGTFVRPLGLSDSLFSLGQLADGRSAESPDVRLLSAITIEADGQVAQALGITEGDCVIHLRHQVLNDGSPSIYHWEYVRSDFCVPLADVLIGSLELHGLLSGSADGRFHRAKLALRAAALGEEAARVLGEPAGTPALCLEYLFTDSLGLPADWGRFEMRAGLFELRTAIGPQ